eukprot:TRINITY_DN663_c0_g1_i11.p1 TRINITY_DN663_c0_g1~~TRINITY_DN663_c0_g1_i11.p1  ORF type:complete len:125 (+),score=36.16 TRINITY_DN663_c0_g1_i11:176-550(+)
MRLLDFQTALETFKALPVHLLLSKCFSLIESGKTIPATFPKEKDKIWKKTKRGLDLVAFVIAVDSEDHLVMVQEKSGKWFLPAGHFEAGEDIVKAARRETKEEAGIEVTVTRISQIIYGTYKSG